jgi:hypothetical protein
MGEPTTFLEETVDLDTAFDIAIVTLQNEPTTAGDWSGVR